MAKLRIELELDPEYVDPSHESGITEDGYEELIGALNAFGEDITTEIVD